MRKRVWPITYANVAHAVLALILFFCFSILPSILERQSPGSVDKPLSYFFGGLVFSGVTILAMIFSIGWVEVEDGNLTYKKVTSFKSVRLDEIGQLGFQKKGVANHVRFTPFVEGKDGSEIELSSLRCMSEQGVTKMIVRIHDAIRDSQELDYPGLETPFGN